MTAAWLLPIIPTVVTAATGSVVAEVLANDSHTLLTILVSYILWGTGVSLSMIMLVIYFQRLTFHKLPPRFVVATTVLPMGPLGQGAFGIMQLGLVSRNLFPRINFLSPIAGEGFYIIGTLIALILWGFALIWLWFAIATLCRGPFPFNLGWWAFIFPVGVFACATILFGREFDSIVFHILGTIISICVIVSWVIVGSATVWNSVTGKLFVT